MKKILILASNPEGDLNLNTEIMNLKRVIENSPNSPQFNVEIELQARPDNLQELFFKYEPRIVHFCSPRLSVDKMDGCTVVATKHL